MYTGFYAQSTRVVISGRYMATEILVKVKQKETCNFKTVFLVLTVMDNNNKQTNKFNHTFPNKCKLDNHISLFSNY